MSTTASKASSPFTITNIATSSTKSYTNNTSTPVEETTTTITYDDAKNKILVKKCKNNIYNKYVYVFNVNGKQKNMKHENLINK